ncbi:Protein white [Trichoplax sp. H2]|nr:Protein white [Trichoplax sp. H2]|eukprot:RDD44667.1 Protein white [Trichoplax sp. H2]
MAGGEDHDDAKIAAQDNKLPAQNSSEMLEMDHHSQPEEDESSILIPSDASEANADEKDQQFVKSNEFPHNNGANVVIPIDKDGLQSDSGVTIKWSNLTVDVKPKGQSFFKRLCCARKESTETKVKSIIRGIHGEVKPGTLVAVMGARVVTLLLTFPILNQINNSTSGAGKTTLLNVLARRNCGSLSIHGDITVNGKSMNRDIAKISAYVQQEELFIGTMKVREHLVFQALLRMEKHFSYEERIMRVDEVIKQLGLTKCANTIIGITGQMRGISGGEKRRLMFASELLTEPKLFFVDEPTSGLDSFMAVSVVTALQNLALDGRTILCTIHQPSSEVYAMFNRILLMAEGKIAYLGPRENALQFFNGLGYHCPLNYNPADHFISQLAIVPSNPDECRERVQAICDAFESSNFFVKPESSVTALLSGLIYLQVKYDQDALQNVAGAIFFIVANSSMGYVFSVLQTFPLELPVFLREHRNGMYRTDVYYICKTMVEMPYFFLLPLLFVVVSYWMIGLNPGFVNFLIHYGIVVLIANVATSYGYLISSMSSSIVVATALGPLFVLPLMIFGGFFLRSGSEPVYLVWIKYISWFNYGFEALSINQWENFGNLTCSPGLPTCFHNGHEVLQFYNFSPENIYFDVGMLAALLVGWRTLTFIVLLIKTSNQHES